MTENAGSPFLDNLNCIKLKNNIILPNTYNFQNILFSWPTNYNFEYTTNSGAQSLDENIKYI